ncbi:MAG: hypothetical protein ABIH72_05185 [archaeon]
MNKLLYYIIAAVGVVILILGFTSSNIPVLKNLPPAYTMIVGLILIILGAVFASQGFSGKARHKQNEVPIYHKNKIIGYRREKAK